MPPPMVSHQLEITRDAKIKNHLWGKKWLQHYAWHMENSVLDLCCVTNIVFRNQIGAWYLTAVLYK